MHATLSDFLAWLAGRPRTVGYGWEVWCCEEVRLTANLSLEHLVIKSAAYTALCLNQAGQPASVLNRNTSRKGSHTEAKPQLGVVDGHVPGPASWSCNERDMRPHIEVHTDNPQRQTALWGTKENKGEK